MQFKYISGNFSVMQLHQSIKTAKAVASYT